MQKFKIYFSFAFILLSITLFSQNERQTIDSLFNELKKTDDKNKVEIFNKISTNYLNISLDSSLYFANEALNLAHIVQDKKGLSDAYNRIGNVYFYQNEYKPALDFYSKSLEISNEINDSEQISKTCADIANLYSAENNYLKALEFLQQGLNESINRKENESISLFNIEIAYVYQDMGKYKESIAHFLKALKFAEEGNNDLLFARIYNGIGNAYFEISSYDQALKYFLMALEVYKINNNQDGLSMIYNNLGIIFSSLKENDNALKYFQKSLEIDIKTNNISGQATAYNNLGTVYDDKGDKEKALNYYNNSLTLCKKATNQKGIATAQNNIGLIYLDLGDFDKAYQNLKESADLIKEINDIYSLANIYNNMAKLFLRQKDYREAQNKLNLAIELSKQINTKEWLLESYDLYSQLFSELNNYKKALDYYKLYTEMKDSLFASKSSNRITEMKIKYETDNLETENELLKKDNQIHILELNRQKNIKNYWIAFSILILALAVLSFRQFSLKKKTNSLLKSKNDQLSEANKKLTISGKNLKELNATKDKFFSIIAHDLKNPFQSLLGFSEALYNQIEELSKTEIKEYTKLIYESSQNLFNLLENLLQWSKSQLKSIKLYPENIILHDSIEDTISLLKIPIQKKSIKIESHIPKDTTVFADRHVVSTVLRNLISNALKFTDQDGEIIISSITNNNKITVSVKDNGKGISKENLDKLFRIDQGYSTKGTEDESGTGLGLILCKELILQSNGDIFVESEIGKGSNFQFSLPLFGNKSK